MQPSERDAAQDRMVHAVTYDGVEVVRYDRAGKWYLEGRFARVPTTLNGAVQTAIKNSGDIRLGLPGGGRFDALVRRLRGF